MLGLEMLSQSYFWWILSVLLLIVEIVTPTTIFIFPSIVALVVGVVSLIMPFPIVLLLLFIGGTILSLMIIRPIFVLGDNNQGYKQGQQALIGKFVRVVMTIDNNKDQGQIKHESDIFPARSVDDIIIPEGKKVIIEYIEGITMFVKTDDENKQ